MLKLAALALAAASASAPPALVSTSSWWEKITVTVAGDGKPQSCSYESSGAKGLTSGCEVEGGGEMSATPAGARDEYTRITFERRFIPGDAQPESAELHPGDTLLGGQVMALAIGAGGEVKGCKVVATAGEMKPDYGCAEAAAERFEAKAGAADSTQLGFMTVMVYGHEEHLA